MLSEKEVSIVYETLLSSPGMHEPVKLDLRIPRKYVLLLVKIMEGGLKAAPGEQAAALLRSAGQNVGEELQQILQELLQKAGLSDMNQKLLGLQNSAANK